MQHLTLLLLSALVLATSQRLAPRVFERSFQQANTTVFNVKEFGAKADGVTNDANSIQKAISFLQPYGGVLYFPTGRYLIESTLSFANLGKPFTITGDGLSSQLLWGFDGHLLNIPSGSGNRITISEIMITSTKVNKNLASTAVYAQDMTQSQIVHVWFNQENPYNLPSCIAMKGIADSNTVRDVQMWVVSGTGLEIGRGSEVRMAGGRIIGTSTRKEGVGIHCTGNNGGVHIDSTDIIALKTGVILDNSSGAGSNREIFITQATLDSNSRGLEVYDSSYISIAGLWAASSDLEQIWVDVNTSAILTITGGTIYNGGVYGCTNPAQQCNGMTVNSGSFMLTGVEIRNNHGKGVWVPNPAAVKYTINGCRIFSNGQGVNLEGNAYVFTSNICDGNVASNHFGGAKGLVQNNIGC
jgi:hypothetical protein